MYEFGGRQEKLGDVQQDIHTSPKVRWDFSQIRAGTDQLWRENLSSRGSQLVRIQTCEGCKTLCLGERCAGLRGVGGGRGEGYEGGRAYRLSDAKRMFPMAH